MNIKTKNSTKAEEKIIELEKRISYTFLDKSLLYAALTHTSYINEKNSNSFETIPKEQAHNERLEFLGDAVLELLVSEELFTRNPQEREGILTHSRSKLVNEQTLCSMAKKLELDKYIMLGKGEETQGGRERASILSDAIEALLAAIYLDSRKNPLYPDPLQAARELINSLYSELWEMKLVAKETKDYKTLLQEITQAQFKDTPKYALILSEGPEHQKSFTIELTLPNDCKITQKGSSKKNAEQLAAQKAVDLLKK